MPAYTVKVHAKFPAEQPAIRGVLCLHDAATGDLLAVMDSTYLTAARTESLGAMRRRTARVAHFFDERGFARTVSFELDEGLHGRQLLPASARPPSPEAARSR